MATAFAGPLTLATVPGVLAGFVPPADGVVDLAGVTQADSSALALLLECTRRAQARGTTLVCVNAPPQLAALAHFFELDDVIPLEAHK